MELDSSTFSACCIQLCGILCSRMRNERGFTYPAFVSRNDSQRKAPQTNLSCTSRHFLLVAYNFVASFVDEEGTRLYLSCICPTKCFTAQRNLSCNMYGEDLYLLKSLDRTVM
ncbi:hypothetical protein ACET3Z_009817 [Daucus carota]